MLLYGDLIAQQYDSSCPIYVRWGMGIAGYDLLLLFVGYVVLLFSMAKGWAKLNAVLWL